jgi:glucose dehydrogenase
VNYWETADGRDRRLIFSAGDMLQQIDAQTGESISSFGVNGRVDLREGLDRDPSSIRQQTRTPGRVFENLIIMGSATNQEYGSAPGDIRAFDVRTGKLVWQFHTVPRPGEFGYETWPPDAYKTIGGANNWGEQSIDSARGILFVPTGSPKYNFYGGNRPGNNLYGDCLVALDVRTGKRLWHFQTVHHDIWDLDNNSAPQLTTIRRNGQLIDIVAVASKTGYLYVFNRVTGEPIWPIEERPVPQGSKIPGEWLSPTQPFPTAPPPFSRQKFTADDVNPHILTPAEREQFRQRVAKARNDGPFTPIDFEEVVQMPGNQGGSNWGSTAANPSDGSVYVIGFNIPALLKMMRPGETRARAGGPPEVITAERPIMLGFGLLPTMANPPYTTLTSYDLNAGTIKWQIGLGDDLRLASQGIKGTGSASSTKGGLIVTSTGLVFATAADRKVHVYDSATGRQISEIALSGNTSGAPSMYELNGKLYLLVTGGGITAYALP